MTALTFRIEADPSAIPRRLDEQRAALAKRLRGATDKAARETVLEPLRAQTRAAFKSRKLPTTWRFKLYPEDEASQTLNPAGFIFSKAAQIIVAFDKGATIHPLNGRRYLWIPTQNVPRTTGGRAKSPKEILRSVGKIAFAKGPHGTLVVLANVASSEALSKRRARVRRRGLAKPSEADAAAGHVRRVALFILTPQVSLKKRLDIAGVVARARAQYPVMLQQAAAQIA